MKSKKSNSSKSSKSSKKIPDEIRKYLARNGRLGGLATKKKRSQQKREVTQPKTQVAV